MMALWAARVPTRSVPTVLPRSRRSRATAAASRRLPRNRTIGRTQDSSSLAIAAIRCRHERARAGSPDDEEVVRGLAGRRLRHVQPDQDDLVPLADPGLAAVR